MAGAENHNRLRAHALAVLIMDTLRASAAIGEPVTLWSLNRAICDKYRLHGSVRNRQYIAVRRVVDSLEAAGLIGSEKKWETETERYIKRLWPCSAN